MSTFLTSPQNAMYGTIVHTTSPTPLLDHPLDEVGEDAQSSYAAQIIEATFEDPPSHERSGWRTPSITTPPIVSAAGGYGWGSESFIPAGDTWRENSYKLGGSILYTAARSIPHIPKVNPASSTRPGPSIASSGPNGAWFDCVKALREYDQHMVQGWKEDVDSLLVFAGLFSAVVTAFNIESYRLLQEDPDETTAALLSRISAQLAADSATVPHTLPVTDTAFQPDSRSVRINILWFSSLVLSLVSASIGILTKQWLREYTRSAASSPRETARIRQLRHEAFVKWNVPFTIALLPILLQVAMVLFFAGLLDLLWSLNTTVAGVVTAIVVMSLSFLVLTTIMPTFRGDCPYKSPQSLGIYLVMQGLVRLLSLLALKIYSWLGWNRPKWPLMIDPSFFRPWKRRLAAHLLNLIHRRFFGNWREREMAIVHDSADKLDQRVLADADSTFMEDDFLAQTISACLNDTEPAAAVKSLQNIITHRADTVLHDVPHWRHRDTVDGGVTLLLRLLLDVLPRMDSADHTGINKMLNLADSLCHAIPFEIDHYDTAILYQRLFEVLARFLTCDRPVQARSFSLMRSMWARSNAPIRPVVIQRLISFARTAKQGGDLPTFHAACEITLAFSTSAALPQPSFESIKNELRYMLADLEDYLTTPDSDLRAAGSAQSASILLALVELDDRDPTLIESERLRAPLGPVRATGPQLAGGEHVSSFWRRRLAYARQLREYREQHPHASMGRRRTTVTPRTNLPEFDPHEPVDQAQIPPAAVVPELTGKVRFGSSEALSRSETVASVCTGAAPLEGLGLDVLTLRTASL